MTQGAVDGMARDVERFLKEVVGLDLPTEPRMLTGDRHTYAVDHLYEEFEEFRLAETLEGQLDALVDLAYVALGRIVETGVSPTLAFDAVHEANMTKLPGTCGHRPDVQLDAVKPTGWQPPDFSRALTIGLALFNWSDTPKILVIGHANHGKDTVGEMMRDEYGLAFTSSSMFCAEQVMMPYFNNRTAGPGQPRQWYVSTQACFEDRANHRQAWYEAIRDFNRSDASALGRAIFAENDVYVGLRSKAELNALRNSGVVDHVIWVDRSDHVVPEGRESCTVEPWMADYVVDNNGTLEDLRFNVCQLMDMLMGEVR